LKDTHEITIEYLRPPDNLSAYKNRLLYADEKVIVSEGIARPKRVVIVEGSIVLDQGYPVVWFVFRGEWYDIGKVYDRKNRLKGYYSDIIKPAEIENNTVRITDLFLDLWISTKREVTILDMDEYNEAVEKGWLEDRMAIEARTKLDHLVELTRERLFPPRFVVDFHKREKLE